MTAIARQMGNGLRHEGRLQAVLLRDRLHHVLEKGVAIGRGEGISVLLIHLKLSIGILMVILISPPAQLKHTIYSHSTPVLTGFCPLQDLFQYPAGRLEQWFTLNGIEVSGNPYHPW